MSRAEVEAFFPGHGVDADPPGISAGDYTLTLTGLRTQDGHRAGSLYADCVELDVDRLQREMCSVVITLTIPGFKGSLTASGILPAFPPPEPITYTLAITAGTHQLRRATGEMTVSLASSSRLRFRSTHLTEGRSAPAMAVHS